MEKKTNQNPLPILRDPIPVLSQFCPAVANAICKPKVICNKMGFDVVSCGVMQCCVEDVAWKEGNVGVQMNMKLRRDLDIYFCS